MKKKLNTENIANELEGASLFFKKSPASSPLPEPVHEATDNSPNPIPDSPTLPKVEMSTHAQNEDNPDQKRSNERTLERPNERTIVHMFKQKREKIRHTFDIYRDQLIDLQRIQWERVQSGKKKPKLGKMVSEGIDLFIKQQASKKKRA